MKKMIILSALLIAAVTSVSAQPATYVLTGADAETLYGSFQYALENSPNQQATQWLNAATGLTGSTIPLKTYRNSGGQFCRDYFTSVQISGKNQQAFGSACRVPDGHWKIISEQLVDTHIQLVRSNPVVAGQTVGCNKGFVHPPVGQSSVRPLPQSKNHYHSKPPNHIHGNKYQPGQLQRGMPQVMPKRQPLQHPSKLVKLVEYRAE